MTSIASTALSGMQAALAQLDASASRVASRGASSASAPAAPGARPAAGAASSEGSLEADLVAQLQAKSAFAANLAVFKTGNAMAGALLNVKA